MTVGSTLVAVGFGLMMGWGMRSHELERRPLAVSFITGVAAGTMMLTLSLGSHPGLAGGSLIVGCLSALAMLVILPPR